RGGAGGEDGESWERLGRNWMAVADTMETSNDR
ncbi:MAG: hypothetical protein QOE61_4123, partial [Micromonosporaceae bacterium]|nr:hypothetical protein [Micromonosporaceae bacterium]